MLERTDYSVEIPKINIDFDAMKTSINQPTGKFFYDPWEIKPEYKGSVWETLLRSLPEPHGEARIIVMQPGTTYMSHADIDNRWHLNLQGEQSFLIDLENLDMYQLEQNGYWYYMDAGRLHVASNYGSIPRVQLIVRELLIETNITNLVEVTIRPKNKKYDYRYKFDNIISPWLNRTNASKLLKDFSFNDDVVKFKTSVDQLDRLKLTEDFEIEMASVS